MDKLTDKQKKINKQIEERERKFKAMNASQKRCAIAQDVIDSIKANKIQPTSGKWVEYSNVTETKLADLRDLQWKDSSNETETQLQDVYKDMPKCSACALGAMFVCAVLRHDHLTVDEADYGSVYYYDINEYLVDFFKVEQIELIECAYERGKGQIFDETSESLSDVQMNNATAFGKKYPSNSDRMIAIMKNIIKNNGKFVPNV